MSVINTGSINVNYPTPGVNNNSQGFRDNFVGIKTNLDSAATEISELQAKTIVKSALTGVVLNNDMANTLISNAAVQGFRAKTFNLGNNLGNGSSLTINVSNGDVQYGTITGNVTLGFTKWAPSGTQSNVQLILNVANNDAVINFPMNITDGAITLENYSGNGLGGLVTIPTGVSKLHYNFTTIDCGTNIEIQPLDRPRIGASTSSGSISSVILSGNSNQVLSGAGTWVPGIVTVGVPESAIGILGDTAGSMKISTTYLYVCTRDYNGSSVIWKQVALSALYSSPVPSPVPAPAPVPSPVPAPAPVPSPVPSPAPVPSPVPSPSPVPVPVPAPAPVPMPTTPININFSYIWPQPLGASTPTIGSLSITSVTWAETGYIYNYLLVEGKDVEESSIYSEFEGRKQTFDYARLGDGVFEMTNDQPYFRPLLSESTKSFVVSDWVNNLTVTANLPAARLVLKFIPPTNPLLTNTLSQWNTLLGTSYTTLNVTILAGAGIIELSGAVNQTIKANSLASTGLSGVYDRGTINVIQDGAFSDNPDISIARLRWVTTIGDYAFSNCDGLSQVDISSATVVSSSAFQNCNVIDNVKFNSIIDPDIFPAPSDDRGTFYEPIYLLGQSLPNYSITANLDQPTPGNYVAYKGQTVTVNLTTSQPDNLEWVVVPYDSGWGVLQQGAFPRPNSSGLTSISFPIPTNLVGSNFTFSISGIVSNNGTNLIFPFTVLSAPIPVQSPVPAPVPSPALLNINSFNISPNPLDFNTNAREVTASWNVSGAARVDLSWSGTFGNGTSAFRPHIGSEIIPVGVIGPGTFTLTATASSGISVTQTVNFDSFYS